MKLETERLIFREYTKDDFQDLKEIISDPETMKYYDKPYDDNGVLRWINWNLDNYSRYGYGLFVLILKETGEFIGDCGITMQYIDKQILPEIGYHINKKFWRKGYGKEAALKIRDWAFLHTDFPALFSYMNVENIPSSALARSIGMNRIKDYFDDSGEHLYVYRITKDEWKKINLL